MLKQKPGNRAVLLVLYQRLFPALIIYHELTTDREAFILLRVSSRRQIVLFIAEFPVCNFLKIRRDTSKFILIHSVKNPGHPHAVVTQAQRRLPLRNRPSVSFGKFCAKSRERSFSANATKKQVARNAVTKDHIPIIRMDIPVP